MCIRLKIRKNKIGKSLFCFVPHNSIFCFCVLKTQLTCTNYLHLLNKNGFIYFIVSNKLFFIFSQEKGKASFKVKSILHCLWHKDIFFLTVKNYRLLQLWYGFKVYIKFYKVEVLFPKINYLNTHQENQIEIATKTYKDYELMTFCYDQMIKFE